MDSATFIILHGRWRGQIDLLAILRKDLNRTILCYTNVEFSNVHNSDKL